MEERSTPKKRKREYIAHPEGGAEGVPRYPETEEDHKRVKVEEREAREFVESLPPEMWHVIVSKLGLEDVHALGLSTSGKLDMFQEETRRRLGLPTPMVDEGEGATGLFSTTMGEMAEGLQSVYLFTTPRSRVISYTLGPGGTVDALVSMDGSVLPHTWPTMTVYRSEDLFGAGRLTGAGLYMGSDAYSFLSITARGRDRGMSPKLYVVLFDGDPPSVIAFDKTNPIVMLVMQALMKSKEGKCVASVVPPCVKDNPLDQGFTLICSAEPNTVYSMGIYMLRAGYTLPERFYGLTYSGHMVLSLAIYLDPEHNSLVLCPSFHRVDKIMKEVGISPSDNHLERIHYTPVQGGVFYHQYVFSSRGPVEGVPTTVTTCRSFYRLTPRGSISPWFIIRTGAREMEEATLVMGGGRFMMQAIKQGRSFSLEVIDLGDLLMNAGAGTPVPLIYDALAPVSEVKPLTLTIRSQLFVSMRATRAASMGSLVFVWVEGLSGSARRIICIVYDMVTRKRTGMEVSNEPLEGSKEDVYLSEGPSASYRGRLYKIMEEKGS